MRVRLLLAFLLVLACWAVAQAIGRRRGAMRGRHARVVVRNARLGAPAKAPPARSLASATGEDRRYALANGCYSLRSRWVAGSSVKDAAGYSAAVGSTGGAGGLPHAGHAARLLSLLRPRPRLHGGRHARRGRARERRGPGRRLARGQRRRRTPSPITLPSQNKALGVTAGRLVLVDPRGRGRVHVRAGPGLRGVPGGRDLGHRKAVHQPHAVGRGQGHDRPPPPRHGVRVPRRQGALRQAVVSLRRALRARRLSRPPGRERLRRRPRERPLRQPGALPRPGRLADLQGLAEPRLAHPRADLLQVDRARVHGRAARDGEPVRREQAAVRAVSVQAEQLRRDGLGAPPEQGHRGAPGLHRRPERRSRPRLVPHRDRPVPGAAA